MITLTELVDFLAMLTKCSFLRAMPGDQSKILSVLYDMVVPRDTYEKPKRTLGWELPY
jgi:hypothetical protein